MKSSFLYILLIAILASCGLRKEVVFHLDNLYAWCIVPFDNKKRSPIERIQMLQDNGLKEYAYDWRKEHIPDMATEWQLAKENGINIRAVYIWIDNQWDKVGQLNKSNEILLNTIKEQNLETEIWIAFHSNYYEGLSDIEAIEKGKMMIEYLSNRAEDLNCKIALYNHGSWYGQPRNQIEIIKTLPGKNLGLIYNFHHAYNHVDTFSDFVQEMIPYLWSVNLSGVVKGDDSIVEIGDGDYEEYMINLLLKHGYAKPFGVLGHQPDKDVAIVLRNNIEGLSSLKIKGE